MARARSPTAQRATGALSSAPLAAPPSPPRFTASSDRLRLSSCCILAADGGASLGPGKTRERSGQAACRRFTGGMLVEPHVRRYLPSRSRPPSCSLNGMLQDGGRFMTAGGTFTTQRRKPHAPPPNSRALTAAGARPGRRQIGVGAGGACCCLGAAAAVVAGEEAAKHWVGLGGGCVGCEVVGGASVRMPADGTSAQRRGTLARAPWPRLRAVA